MQPRDMAVLGTRNRSKDDSYAQLGYVAGLLSAIPPRRYMPIEVALWLADIAISHHQIEFYFTKDGQPVAYLIWATVAEDVESKIMRHGIPLLHISEWNEGSLLWIIDLVAPYGHLPIVVRDLRDRVFETVEIAQYVRFRGRQRVLRRLSRSAQMSFFRTKRVPRLAGPTRLPGW